MTVVADKPVANRHVGPYGLLVIGQVQQSTVRTLVCAQAVGALGTTIGIATASLLAKELSGSDTLAGSAQTTQVLGTAVVSALLARIMRAQGRRIGLATGFTLGSLGATLAVLAGVLHSLPVLLVGTFLLGAVTSANLASRYAATDLAEPSKAGRALSLVVWATTIGAVVGPNLTGPAADLARSLGIGELTGPFVIAALATFAAGAINFVWLRPDPLLLARVQRQVFEQDLPAPKLAEVLRGHPMLVIAIVGMAASHAVMVSVMVMTPLHMEHGGAALSVIGFVISIHVLGMFAFSPLVGWAVDRWGAASMLAAGGGVSVVALIACGMSPEGQSPHIVTGLFLLGLGWSMSTVAAATLISTHAPAEAATTVQGAGDVIMSVSAASASVFSGVIVGGLGFPMLTVFAGFFAVASIASAMLGRRTRAELVRVVS